MPETTPVDSNVAAKQAAAEVVKNQTVGVYDEDAGDVVQMDPKSAQEMADMGYTVGDRAAEKRALYNSTSGKVTTFLNSALNTASFGTYGHLLNAVDPELLTTQHDLEAENPKTAFGGVLAGGALTGELRGLSLAKPGLGAAQLGLAAYEGASNTYNEGVALKHPVAAEQIMQGAGYGLLFNIATNGALYGGARVAGLGGRALRGANDKLGLFKRAVQAGDEAAEGSFQVRPKGAASVAQDAEAVSAAETKVPESVPYENPADGEIHSDVKKVVDANKHDPELIKRDFAEAEKAWHDTLIKLDKAKPGTPEHAKLEVEANQYHHAVNELQEHMAINDPSIKPPPEPHAGTEVEWHYPDNLTTNQQKRVVGKYYDKLLGEPGAQQQAVYLELKSKLADITSPGDRARLFAKIHAVEKEMHLQYPRSVHPETGDIQPGWRDTQREYSRLHGNDYVDLDSVKFRVATADERQKIKLGEETQTNRENLGLKADKEPDNPFESLGEKKATGPYQPRFKRWDLLKYAWHSGPFRPLVHTLAAANELGPFVLNNTDRFAQGMLKLAEASNTRIGKALKGAISAKESQDSSRAVADIHAEYDKTQTIVSALSASPEALEQGMRDHLGAGADRHPELAGNLVAAAGRVSTVIGQNMARNPNAPTPRKNTYDPPRSEKARVVRLARAVFDPAYVIAHPDADSWAAVQAVHPETAKMVQDTILNVVSNPQFKLTRTQARKFSILAGVPITPQNQPEYLKSLQDAASVMNQPMPPGKQNGGGGGGSHGKLDQQILTSTATPNQQAELGL